MTDGQIACIDHTQIIYPTSNMKTEISEPGQLHREPQSWPGLAALRGKCHRFLRLESMAPGAHNVLSSSRETDELPQAVMRSGHFGFLCMFP